MEWIDKSSGNRHKKTFYSNYIMEPLEVKYSALRLNNFRPYLLGGIFGLQDLGRKKEGALQLKRLDFGFVIGGGVDLYFRKFKLCPEIKYAFGLKNMMVMDPHAEDVYPDTYVATLEKLKTRMLIVTISFE